MVKKTKKYKKNDYSDLIAVSLIALVALINKEGNYSTVSDATPGLFYALVFILIIFFFIVSGLSIFNSKRLKRSRQNLATEAIRVVNLNWGQELKHNLVLYLLPIFILILPLMSNRTAGFTDFFQAVLAFIAISYLKNIYWGKFL